jgi:hypothetical protein
MLLTEEKFKKIVGGKIFTVKFTKKDGSIRTLNGRLGVKRHLRGGKIRYNASEKNNVIVYDLKNKGYRTLNLSSLELLKCGEVYE